MEQSRYHEPEKINEPAYPVPIKRRSKKPLLIVLAVIVLAGAAATAGYLTRPKPAKPSAPVVANATAKTPANNGDVPDAKTTKTFQNGLLGLTLTYPDTWTATEATDNDSSVRLESPSFSYPTATKGTVTGNFRIYIRKAARAVDGKYIGRGYAIAASEKLTYAKPAPGQLATTNLSLFGLDTPDNFAFFMIAGNYSLNKGDTLGPNYGKEAEAYIIAGGYSAPELKDDLATNPVAPDLLKTSNAYKQALEIIKSLQLH